MAEATLVDAAWAHWTVLTAAAVRADRRRAWTIVDPEALVLASLVVGHVERRLDDMVASWATGAARLMSMHRMRTLASRFPPAGRERLGMFARPAIAGGDKRWKRVGATSVTDEYTPRIKPLGELRLIEAPALTLRLRAGFGVNAKADLLSLLIGLRGAAADLKVIAAATAYTERAIRTATEEMSLAGFIHEIHGRPSSFYAEPDVWARLLQTYRIDGDQPTERPALPPWRFWAAVLAFLAHVLEWSNSADSEGWSAYVASSRARDVLDSCRRQLHQAQIRVPSSGATRGTDFLREFEDLVHEAEAWTRLGLYGSE